MNNKEFYYDLAKIKAEVLTSRSNFLLIIQSMLFGIVASIADKQTFIPMWLVLTFGLLTSIVWFYLNWLMYFPSQKAFRKLVEMDRRVHEIWCLLRQSLAISQRKHFLHNGFHLSHSGLDRLTMAK